jgi:hypothetical protein
MSVMFASCLPDQVAAGRRGALRDTEGFAGSTVSRARVTPIISRPLSIPQFLFKVRWVKQDWPALLSFLVKPHPASAKAYFARLPGAAVEALAPDYAKDRLRNGLAVVHAVAPSPLARLLWTGYMQIAASDYVKSIREIQAPPARVASC